jgi:hypothetical protein
MKKFTIKEVQVVFNYAALAHATGVREIVEHNSISPAGMLRSIRARTNEEVGADGYITDNDLYQCLAVSALDYVKNPGVSYYRCRLELYKAVIAVLIDHTISRRKLRGLAFYRQAMLFSKSRRKAAA